jgi:NAD(P)-dependent dehydrogenase (short-subunit alcohol dehydrogenase family)
VDDLAGRVAVVTGGASGIGRAIVLELAAAGMDVVVADIEDAPARDVADEARAAGARAIAVHTDVADYASVQALADASYDEFGAVHVLCNNAGVLVFGDIPDLKIEDWNWLFGVNVFGVLHGIYGFLPRMLESGEPGHIVNTASIAALSGHGIYGVSKSTILNITESLQRDLVETPIGVTALCPGMLNTKIVAAQRNRPASMGPKAHEPYGSDPVSFGVDPAHCGRRVREAILTGELYAFAGIPRGNEAALKAGPVPHAQALVDAVDRGIVDED